MADLTHIQHSSEQTLDQTRKTRENQYETTQNDIKTHQVETI